MNWDNVKGDCVIGGREGKGNRRGGNYRISANRFFPRRIKFTLERIYGGGGYIRIGGLVLKRTPFFQGAE